MGRIPFKRIHREKYVSSRDLINVNDYSGKFTSIHRDSSRDFRVPSVELLYWKLVTNNPQFQKGTPLHDYSSRARFYNLNASQQLVVNSIERDRKKF